MPIPFNIVITKEIITQCKNCGTGNDIRRVENNCAIAIALADIFPSVYVTNLFIFPFGIDRELKIPIPTIAQQFINLFDGFRLMPGLRLMLPAFEFIIDIPDEVVEHINIDEVKELIKKNDSATTKAKMKATALVRPHLL